MVSRQLVFGKALTVGIRDAVLVDMNSEAVLEGMTPAGSTARLTPVVYNARLPMIPFSVALKVHWISLSLTRCSPDHKEQRHAV